MGYIFYEPHETGGDATVKISRSNIIAYMKKRQVERNTKLSEDELVEEFCTVFYAVKVNTS